MAPRNQLPRRIWQWLRGVGRFLVALRLRYFRGGIYYDWSTEGGPNATERRKGFLEIVIFDQARINLNLIRAASYV